MSIKKYKAVNTTNTTMKGGEKMNSQKLNWANIYDGGDAHKIIENLYNEQNYKELHRAQWLWLSLDSERSEYEWFDTFGVPKVRNHCFACQEAYSCLPKWYEEKIADFEEELADFDEYRPAFCPCCPITDWAEEECFDGLYAQWLEADLEEREDVAMEIASLEWQYK